MADKKDWGKVARERNFQQVAKDFLRDTAGGKNPELKHGLEIFEGICLSSPGSPQMKNVGGETVVTAVSTKDRDLEAYLKYTGIDYRWYKDKSGDEVARATKWESYFNRGRGATGISEGEVADLVYHSDSDGTYLMNILMEVRELEGKQRER